MRRNVGAKMAEEMARGHTTSTYAHVSLPRRLPNGQTRNTHAVHCARQELVALRCAATSRKSAGDPSVCDHVGGNYKRTCVCVCGHTICNKHSQITENSAIPKMPPDTAAQMRRRTLAAAADSFKSLCSACQGEINTGISLLTSHCALILRSVFERGLYVYDCALFTNSVVPTDDDGDDVSNRVSRGLSRDYFGTSAAHLRSINESTHCRIKKFTFSCITYTHVYFRRVCTNVRRELNTRS